MWLPIIYSLLISSLVERETRRFFTAMSEMTPNAIAFTVDFLMRNNPTAKFTTGQKKTIATNEQNTQKIQVDLSNQNIWSLFHSLDTEMIITKIGRRMFPLISIDIKGLEVKSEYMIWLDIIPVDNRKYRYGYNSSEWIVTGTTEESDSQTTYIHPDSPSPGYYWMSHSIDFDKLKLTNSRDPDVKEQVHLHSMRKYQPRIHIQKVPSVKRDQLPEVNIKDSFTVVFPETQFFTVTAYQNLQITKLKIATNPFAKGFREPAIKRDSKEDCVSSSHTPQESTNCFQQDINKVPGITGYNIFSYNDIPFTATSSVTPSGGRLLHNSHSFHSSSAFTPIIPKEPREINYNFYSYNNHLPFNRGIYFPDNLPVTGTSYHDNLRHGFCKAPTCMNPVYFMNTPAHNAFSNCFYYKY